MINKTLGGDRLGSGKKMQVGLHSYERSTHDLSYIWRSTMSAGTLVPFMSKVLLPGDTFDINLDADIKTLPTIGPLFGSYKVQLDVFVTPMRLYNSLLHNNMLGIGLDMSRVRLPVIQLTTPTFDPSLVEDIDNCQINPSCILSYLGLRGIGLPDTLDRIRSFNCVPLLAYWDIYKNYYSNKQEKIGAVIHTAAPVINTTVITVTQTTAPAAPQTIQQKPASAPTDELAAHTVIDIGYTGAVPDPNTIIFFLPGVGGVSAHELMGGQYEITAVSISGSYDFNRFGSTYIINWDYLKPTDPRNVEPRVVTFPLDNIDNMRKLLLAYSTESVGYIINDANLAPYNYLHTLPANEFSNLLSSQEGLGLKTYQSDLFNNWLDAEYMDAISQASAVSTVGDVFTIDQLNLSQKIYEMLNRIAVSGGSYSDWIDAAYGINKTRMAESPVYCGGLIKELIFQEVISNAESDTQPLGTLAGKGRLSSKHKGGYIDIRVEEPSYVIGIISLTPRIDYSQGNSWDMNLKTLDDLHKPGLDQIGFQDLMTEQMAWWDVYSNNGTWTFRSAGKQPAWLNYMTDTNVTRGNFAIATNQMFMTLNRRYEYVPGTGIGDLTTYIDPGKFNFIFAQTSLDSQNFWVQIGCNITARRKMSAKIMPNL